MGSLLPPRPSGAPSTPTRMRAGAWTRGAVAWWLLSCALSVTSCGRPKASAGGQDGAAADSGSAGDSAGDSGGTGGTTDTDLPPFPRLTYQTRTPVNQADYPFSSASPPAAGPAPRATVYLSAQGSGDPEGQPISFFWNVQDPDGQYLTIHPAPEARDVSFWPARVGPHAVTLEIVEEGGRRQIGHTTVVLMVAPLPCAPDGVSAPCSGALPVPGGRFMAGADGLGDDAGDSDGQQPNNEGPRHAATVAPFELDRYEVTVGRFRRYLSAFTGEPPPDGSGAHPRLADSGWQPGWRMTLGASRADFSFAISECGGTWTDDVGASEARPMTCVTWFEAFAFCAWDGKRLPTEAEWEYASAGGDQQRLYPWGDDTPSPARAVYGCLFDGDPACDAADLPVVGSLSDGAGRWGHLDLAGSVWEWMLDAYTQYTGAACDDCAPIGVDVMAGHVFRGGDFKFGDVHYLRASARLGFTGGFPDEARGFRCARSLAPAPTP